MGLCISKTEAKHVVYCASETAGEHEPGETAPVAVPAEEASQPKEAASGQPVTPKDRNKQAVHQFHEAQHQSLRGLTPVEQILADVQLTGVLGTGGFAAVLSGFWRGSTPVAVKLFAVTPHPLSASASADNTGQLSSELASQLPARALAEAVLARDLAHPQVIHTYDVRTCEVTPLFAAAVYSGPATAGVAGQARSTAASKQEVQEVVQGYKGLTPLWPDKPLSTRAGGSKGAGDTCDSFACDNWSDRGGQAISWLELLMTLGAKPGDLLTAIIMQQAKLGTLWVPIRAGVFDASQQGSPQFPLVTRARALLRTAREVATGLEHLHACGVVHGDIKPGNILLNDSRADKRGFTALVADFGLAHVLLASKHVSSDVAGTTAYMSPELLGMGRSSAASDMYAFGITLWEMTTGRHAHDKMRAVDIVLGVQLHGLRPEWPPGLLPDVGDFYKRCVSAVATERPTAAEAVTFFGEAEERVRAAARGNAAAAGGPAAAGEASGAQSQYNPSFDATRGRSVESAMTRTSPSK